jgi:hypothetical protein
MQKSCSRVSQRFTVLLRYCKSPETENLIGPPPSKDRTPNEYVYSITRRSEYHSAENDSQVQPTKLYSFAPSDSCRARSLNSGYPASHPPPRGVADRSERGSPYFITPMEINLRTGSGTFCTDVSICSDGGQFAVSQPRISCKSTPLLDNFLMLRAARLTKKSRLPK